MPKPDSLISDCPNLRLITEAVLRSWPDHESFIAKSFSDYGRDDLALLERVAGQVITLCGDELSRFTSHYRWMCNEFMKEEIYFRRHGDYRLKSFAEAEREVYRNTEFMARYMDGLLLSQILWSNHAKSLLFFITGFLPECERGYRYLEVGPGHGLSLSYASADPRCDGITGWDISPVSIEQTRESLRRLDVGRSVRLICQDVMKPASEKAPFDDILIGEVLEHLERPERALRNLFDVLRPGGHIFINMPVNSPAPDHIYLLCHPDQVAAMVENAGFRIVDRRNFPATGFSEEVALERKLTISCALIASRPVED